MKKENQFAIFEYENNDECYVDELLDFINIKGPKIFDFFSIKIPKSKVHIKIIQTKKEFDELLLKNYNFQQVDWSRGFQPEGDENVIYYLSIGDYKNTCRKFNKENLDNVIEDYKKTLLHEFVHYVTSLYRKYVNCGPIARYISEGIACYLSGQFDKGHIHYLDGEIYYDDVKFDANTPEEILYGNTKYQNYFVLVKYIYEWIKAEDISY